MVHCLVRLVNAGFKAPTHADPREMAKEWSRALVGISDHQIDVCITHIIQNNRWWPMPVEILEAYDDLFYHENKMFVLRENKADTGDVLRLPVDSEDIPF